MQRDASVRRRHVVVGLAEHGVHAVQSQELTEQLVRHAVDVQETFQLLKHREYTESINQNNHKDDGNKVFFSSIMYENVTV